MATDYVTDTHGLVWYLEDKPLLGAQAKAAFDACDRGECFIFVPTICLVELFIFRKKAELLLSFSINSTPHCSQAKQVYKSLISRDRKIQLSSVLSIW